MHEPTTDVYERCDLRSMHSRLAIDIFRALNLYTVNVEKEKHDVWTLSTGTLTRIKGF
jgi:hypothetical protein